VATAISLKPSDIVQWVGLICLAGVATPASAQQLTGEMQDLPPVTVGGSHENGPGLVLNGEGISDQVSNRPAVISVNRAADLVGRPLDLRSRSGAGSGGSVSARSLPSITPLANAVMTSGFGNRQHPISGGWRRHNGVDLASPHGSEIRATDDGVVVKAQRNGGYGLYVALKHSGGVETSYAHMSRLNVSTGQSVRRGQVIGFVGSTGRSTGPHLHYEVKVNGKAVDPGLVRK
jgi:murein DD-endopeptidase MepM/ murein hydrolase activator NlpD